jgi:hypothetical protein
MKVYKVKKESLPEEKLSSRSTFEIGTKTPLSRLVSLIRAQERARDLASGYLQFYKNYGGVSPDGKFPAPALLRIAFGQREERTG